MEVLKQTSKEAAEVKLSRNAVRGKANRALEIRFEAQRLTSHAGLVVFQRLFARLGLKESLRPCFRHLPERAYPPHAIVLLLVVHLLLGCRGLRDMARYRNDEAVRRAVGLRRLPDVSTVSRVLAGMDGRCVDKVRAANRELVAGRLRALRPGRATVDFDGSVLGTKRQAEGTAAGYNPQRKGQRSYWPLFATVAQTSQALDVLHRPGNVADSTGAREFMDETLARLRDALPGTRLEARADSAFFGEDVLDLFERRRVDYSVSVPFERFPALKQLIESQTRWRKAGRDVECFEPDWKPNSWASQRRIVVIRRRVPIRRPGPLQLDLLEPRAHGFEFKAVVTNKRQSARRVALFHDGRGAQEALFAELKSQCGLSHVPARREPANRLFALAAMLAHNLARELQMAARAPQRCASAKRSPLWNFEQLRTMRNDFLLRAGRFLYPQRKPVLSIMCDPRTEARMNDYLAAFAL